MDQTTMEICQTQYQLKQQELLMSTIQIPGTPQADLKRCAADCLCNVIPTVPPRLDVEDICQVLGRDIVRSSLLEDIELYLECDEDSVYAVPVNKQSAGPQHAFDDSMQPCFTPPMTAPPSDSTDATGRYICPHCSRTFTRRNLVLDHRMRVHGDQNLFPCSFCLYQGKSSSHLKRHFERAHKIKSKLSEPYLTNILQTAHMGASPAGTCSTNPIKNALDIFEHEPTATSGLSGAIDVSFGDGMIRCHQNVGEDRVNDKVLVIGPQKGVIQEIPVPGTDCSVITEIVESNTLPTTAFNNTEAAVDATPRNNPSSRIKLTHAVCCELCPYTCKTAQLLKRHHEALHNQEREVHCCDKCGCTFKQKRSLDIHMKVHSGQFDFKCDVCSKCFASRDHLRLHGRTHITTRQFACGECGKAFRTHGNLAQHERTVHTSAVIKCPEVGCERTFTRRHLAAAHYKIHTGAFRCLQAACGRTFRDAHNLRAHHKTHRSHKD